MTTWRYMVGNGGWIRVFRLDVLPEGTALYVRFQFDDTQRLVPVEIYIETESTGGLGPKTGGSRLRGEHLRRLPLDTIEAAANDAPELVARLHHPAPDLATLASHFITGIGITDHKPPPARARSWVDDALWSQVEDSGVRPAFRLPIEEYAMEPLPKRPTKRLTPPPEGRYTDAWLTQLAAAYKYAVAQWRAGKAQGPAIVLAAEAQVEPNTVRSWIYRARLKGFLPKGGQGKAG